MGARSASRPRSASLCLTLVACVGCSDIDKCLKTESNDICLGDEVVCRHGAGLLAEFDSANPDGPCAVSITVAEYTHMSRFKSAGYSKGGARLRRLPISFAHDSRSHRSDSVRPEVVKKVDEIDEYMLIINMNEFDNNFVFDQFGPCFIGASLSAPNKKYTLPTLIEQHILD